MTQDEKKQYIRDWRRKLLKNFANQGLLPLTVFLLNYYDDSLTPDDVADLLTVNVNVVKDQIKSIEHDCEQIVAIFADVNPFIEDVDE